jgi:hypothetical protein
MVKKTITVVDADPLEIEDKPTQPNDKQETANGNDTIVEPKKETKKGKGSRINRMSKM